MSMNKGGIYIAGEDPVTVEIIRRIVRDYAPSLHIISVQPARGSELKSKVAAFNKLALTTPVILLSDQDTDDCAPIAKENLLKGIQVQAENFIVNIAVDEAEAWLYADRAGLANYLKVEEEKMPVAKEAKFGGPRLRMEMDTPCKTSFHLTHILMKESKDETKRAQILVEGTAKCKGKEYNSALIPFIQDVWNVEAARKHSYSLDRMIRRIQDLNLRYGQSA